MDLTQIYHDESLCGHTLTSLPHALWSFNKGEFCLYDRPDPGTLVVENDYVIARSVHYRKGQTFTCRTEILGEKLLCDFIECVARRIFGPCVTAASFLTLTPIGIGVKIVHFSLLQVSAYIASTALAQKIAHVWNDASLFGDALTSAPSQWYQFTTAPLEWHLRADGTDRRTYIATYGAAGDSVREAEYPLVPFELFECMYRRVLGSAITLIASIASPLGLVIKGVHLVSRAVFAQASHT